MAFQEFGMLPDRLGPSNTILRTRWRNYTPDTDITIGNGTIRGRYLFDPATRLVIVQFEVVFGSTSSMPSNPQNGLPVEFAEENLADTNALLGHGNTFDDSNTTWRATSCERGTDTSHFVFRDVAGGNLSATAPITWATNDRLTAKLVYEGVGS